MSLTHCISREAYSKTANETITLSTASLVALFLLSYFCVSRYCNLLLTTFHKEFYDNDDNECVICSGHPRLCVCLCECLSGDALHALQCNCGGVRVYPLVVHFEMIFKSVHSFRCYDNIHVRIHCKCIRRMRNVSEYLYSLYFWHCAAFLYLFASVATIAYSMSFL